MSEFENTCRLCLRQTEDKMVNASKFDGIIALVCQTRLVKHPLIPRLICKSCTSILLTAAIMRVNCVESNKYFLSYLSSKNEIPYTELEAAEYEFQLDTEKSEGIETALYVNDQLSVNTNLENDICSTQKLNNKPNCVVTSVQKLTKVAIVKDDTLNLQIVGAKKVDETKGYDCQNCRLCLKRFSTLPMENTVANMKDVIIKIMDMKSFDRAQTMIPNKLCDDCLGNVLTASIIADRCKKAYKYFYSKTSAAVITSSSCMVCLKDCQSVNDVCNMSNSTYSYMHYFASRNSDYEYKELEGDKRICLKCMHDLEVANSVRFKNWKAEEVLSLKFSPTKLNKRKSSHASSKIAARQRGRENDDTQNETIDERWKPINPPLTQQADCPHCLKQFNTERNLKLHIEKAHIPSIPDNTKECAKLKYICNMCGLTLNNERTLKAHYLGVHLKKVESICDVCGHIFYSQGKLENHRVIHFDNRNIKCAQCPATFKRLQNLRIHQRIHTGEKKFKCLYCSKAYAHSSDFKRHISSHNVT